MLKVRVYSGDLHVGDAELVATDPPMGCAGGPFRPLASYLRIRPMVQEFCQVFRDRASRDVYSAARARFDALDWTLVAYDGAVLRPSGGIDLYDFEELGDDSLEFHIYGLDDPRDSYRRYFADDQTYREYYRQP